MDRVWTDVQNIKIYQKTCSTCYVAGIDALFWESGHYQSIQMVRYRDIYIFQS